MPLVDVSQYRPPLLLRQGDLHTVLPYLMRRVPGVDYRRERVGTPDGDFLDLDFPLSNTGKRPLVVMVHGLEGDSQANYITGLANALDKGGFDSVALNFRGCSGEANRKLISYHSARTEDLDFVVGLLADRGHADLVVVGFSLGGNVTLKYAGEGGGSLRSELKAVAAVATPCDIGSSCERLQQFRNRLYLLRFMRSLRQKAVEKALQFPEAPFSVDQARKLRNFKEHDDMVTAPIHGFRDADDYYARASSKQYLHGLRIPALLINAQDDPFLTPACMPVEEARRNPYLFLEMPKYGGHVGFRGSNGMAGHFWHEERIISWLGSLGFGTIA